MEPHITGIRRYETSPGSLRDLVKDCGGLDGLRGGDRVFIKPNLVALDDSFPMPYYGVLTTTRLVHDMVILLREHGVTSITIGEGSVYSKEFGVPTDEIYDTLGYRTLEKSFGVRLLDLHKEPFTTVDFQDFTLEISEPALSTDVFINMPVLKTHNQAMVSLGLKNLKGCLSMKSRKFCHRPDKTLERYLARFVEALNPALTVIDGIYGLEKGPFYAGNAVRMNALVGSRDPLSADVAGAAVAGFDPASVPHIRLCAERQGRSADPADLDVVGIPIAGIKRRLRWDHSWREDDTGPLAWDRLGIRGIRFPKYDETLCTGCSGLYSPMLVMIMAAWRGVPFDEIEILTGKAARPSENAKRTLLVGNCMIKAHRRCPAIREAVLAQGCPPTLETLVKGLRSIGIDADEAALTPYQVGLAGRYKGKPEFDESFFTAT